MHDDDVCRFLVNKSYRHILDSVKTWGILLIRAGQIRRAFLPLKSIACENSFEHRCELTEVITFINLYFDVVLL